MKCFLLVFFSKMSMSKKKQNRNYTAVAESAELWSEAPEDFIVFFSTEETNSFRSKHTREKNRIEWKSPGSNWYVEGKWSSIGGWLITWRNGECIGYFHVFKWTKGRRVYVFLFGFFLAWMDIEWYKSIAHHTYLLTVMNIQSAWLDYIQRYFKLLKVKW